MDVVEIDPGLTALAKKYAVVFGDAFKSSVVPFEQSTVECAKKMNNSLSISPGKKLR